MNNLTGKRGLILRAATLFLLATSTANAGLITIDFETGTSGDPIGLDFAKYGVVFRNFNLGDLSQGPNYRELNANNFATDQFRDAELGTTFNVTLDFLGPVSMVSVGALAPTGMTLTMTAYSSGGGLLGSVTSIVSPGFGSVFDTISLSGIGEISTVRWETSSPLLGSPGIDDLTFKPIPGPASFLLIAPGFLAFSFARRRRP